MKKYTYLCKKYLVFLVLTFKLKILCVILFICVLPVLLKLNQSINQSMKTFLTCFLFFLFACNSFGQGVYWEILQGGITFGFPKDNEGNVVSADWERKPTTRFAVGTEIRTNFMENQLSSGLQFTFSEWKRFSPIGSYEKQQFSFIGLAVCDYNFPTENKRIMPYAGMGVGLSRIINNEYIGTDYYTHFAFSPRIGIEILKRLRIAAEYKYQGNGNNFFCVKAGFVIKL